MHTDRICKMLGIQWRSVWEQARAQFFLLWLLFLPVHWMGRKELSQQHNQYNQVYWLTTTDLSWYRRNETKKTFQIFKYLDNFLGATLYMYTGKWMPCSGDVKWDSYFTFLRVSSVVSIQLPVCTVTASIHVAVCTSTKVDLNSHTKAKSTFIFYLQIE